MEFKEQKAIYLQIAERVCDDILAGKYHEGERLPSVRELAMESEVNVNTVARSLEWLQQKGVAVTRRGLGNFVAQGGTQAVEALRRDEFFTELLPGLFHVMHTLGVGISEVVARWQAQEQGAQAQPHDRPTTCPHPA
ncbi:MAG TPA: GntR family transcriptional regulator [Prevotellaceae bacterium]|nr:GntR family transcriptional regulator [Prevotellaceae bacterium]